VLAEDHDAVREGLKAVINLQSDMEVVGEAADGGSAVERAQQLAPDVLVVDLSLPGLTGVQVLRAVRQSCPHTRTLALTRHAATGYVQQVLSVGGAGYVLKRSPLGELLEGIRAVATGRRYIDRAVAAQLVESQAHARTSKAQEGKSLTAREHEVLRLVAQGYSNKEIAARLVLSVKTIETHKANAMQKLGMSTRVDLVRFAHLQGWFDDDD
jgi:DNA-binding NarL/FixJ family response regulator